MKRKKSSTFEQDDYEDDYEEELDDDFDDDYEDDFDDDFFDDLWKWITLKSIFKPGDYVKITPLTLISSLRRVEIHLVGPAVYCTDVRAAMSGIADPETWVQISVRAPVSR